MQRFSLSALQLRGDISAPLAFAIGMMAGTIWYFSVEFEPVMMALAVPTALVWAITIWVRRLGGAAIVLTVCTLVCGAMSGAMVGSLATQRVAHATIAAPTGPVLLEGWILAAQPGRSGVRLVLQVHAVEGLEAAETPRKVRLTHVLSLHTEPGRFVRCWAMLRPPPQPVIQGDYDFARQAWFSGLGAVGYVQGRCRGGALGPPKSISHRIGLQFGTWRRQLARYVQDKAGARAGGFAAALASGDRSFMRLEDQDALRGSGLAHLLAISGLHMGIVGGLVFLFLWRTCALVEPIALRWPVKKPAAIGALLVCTAYLLISGAGLSTQRAFIMSAVAFTAVIFDRTALSLRSLSIAMIIILTLAPWSVLTPGFQMSFAATGALIATYEAWRRRRRDMHQPHRNGPIFWLQSLFVTSAVSGLATTPFALFHFERIAGFGLPANLLAMPIISLLSAPLAGAALLLAPFGGDAWALRLFGASLEAVLYIAHLFADWGDQSALRWPKMPGPSLALFALAIAAYAVVYGGWQKFLAVLGLSGLAILAWIMMATDRIHWAPSGELFLETPYMPVERIEVTDGEGLAPLRFADAPVTRVCADQLPCMIGFGAASIKVSGEETGEVPEMAQMDTARVSIIEVSTGGEHAPRLLINWPDVIAENGITLQRHGRHYKLLKKPDCGSRAWRPCPVE